MIYKYLVFLVFVCIITYLIIRFIYFRNENYLADYDKIKWCKCKTYEKLNGKLENWKIDKN